MIASTLDKRRSACLGAALLVVACSGGSSHPGLAPGLLDTGGAVGAGGRSSASGGRSAGAGAGTANAGTGSGDADAGSTDAASAPHDGGGAAGQGGNGSGGAPGMDAGSDAGPPVFDAGPPVATVCPSKFTTGSATLLGLPAAEKGTFAGVTPDELTIAWTTVVSAQVTVNVADRTSVDDSFAAPATQVVAAMDQRVALSPDGLRLAFVQSSGKAFTVMTRAARSGTFTGTETQEFSNLNDTLPLADGETLGDPLFGANDWVFYFSVNGSTRTKTLFTSLRLEGAVVWGPPRQVELPAAMEVVSGKRRRVNASSADGWTLFYFDEVDSNEHAVRLDEHTGALRNPTLVGNYPFASSGGSCERLYYSTSEGGIDLRMVGLR